MPAPVMPMTRPRRSLGTRLAAIESSSERAKMWAQPSTKRMARKSPKESGAVIARKQTASKTRAATIRGRLRPKRSARAPASGAVRAAPIMFTDMKSEVSSSETSNRSETSERRIGTGRVTGAMIETATSPSRASRVAGIGGSEAD
jgi:hypothetical protein